MRDHPLSVLRVPSFVIFVVVSIGGLVGAACSTEVKGLATPGDAGGDVPPVGLDGPQTRVDAPANCPEPTGPRKQNGTTCRCGNECASGFCVDGVCCNSDCSGKCRACNISTSLGTCSPLPAGAKPVVPTDCAAEPASSCGLDGTCNGAGECRKWPDGTVCGAGRCMGATVVDTRVCQAGACRPGPNTPCTPFGCDATKGQCFSTCTARAQCDNRDCANGSCGKKVLGAACANAAECASGFCADGVCCNLACTGACVSCKLTGNEGRCTPVADGQPDPHGVCKKEAPETCGSSGLCNGQGGCSKYAAGTVCKGASCQGGSQVPASTCNGLGTCLLGSPISCFPYVCAGDSCRATCATNADCAQGRVCMNGSCGRKELGQRCAAAAECRSNFCVDGVCCDAACTGDCRYCGFPNALGRCTTVPAGVPDPRARCRDMGAASCATNGRCNGSGACQSYATGTVCRAESCDAAANRYTAEGVCRSGQCTAPAAITCAPYLCNGTRCGTSCSTGDQCTSGNLCVEGSCGRKPNGSVCARADECTSGFCAQGVCCGSACTASCFSCNNPGQAGACSPVAAGGSDPTGSCKDEGAATCGNDGTCNGMGACRKYASGTVCAAATCTSGMLTAQSTCDGAGVCRKGAASACSPYLCNTGGTACFTSCADDSQCIPGRTCEMGMCGKKDDGAQCNGPDECKSGFCVDGHCCDTACTGTCKTCALGTSLGKCSNIAAGMPDDGGGCTAQSETSCGNDGTCNGMGACRKWGTTTQCAPASCPMGSSTLTKAAMCDGAGMCGAAQTQSCGNFRCDPATNACKTTCTSDADCVAGKACDTATGSCGKSALGVSCTAGTECASGNCVDGTCCTASSCGECKSCANAAGTCQNVANDMPDPDSCSDETGSNPCGKIGKCNGMGACKVAPAGTQCDKMCTMAGLRHRACDGAGACGGMPTTISCNGFECTDGACLTTCTTGTNAGCQMGKICLNNTCQDPGPL